MSTLKTNTLTGTTSAGSILVTGEGGSTTTNLQQGLAKVWSNQTTGTANDSHNSSGITDNGTGDFSVNFSNAMSSANYSSTLGGADANSNSALIVATNNGGGYATGSINYFVVNEDSGATDYGPTCCTVHGDLA